MAICQSLYFGTLGDNLGVDQSATGQNSWVLDVACKAAFLIDGFAFFWNRAGEPLLGLGQGLPWTDLSTRRVLPAPATRCTRAQLQAGEKAFYTFLHTIPQQKIVEVYCRTASVSLSRTFFPRLQWPPGLRGLGSRGQRVDGRRRRQRLRRRADA